MNALLRPGYARHPNFAAVFLIGLGCESNQIGPILRSEKLTVGDKLSTYTIQETGGTRKSEFVTLPGLRPGRSYVGHADDGSTVRVLSLAEPGP